MADINIYDQYKDFTWKERYFLLWQLVSVEFKTAHFDSPIEARDKYFFYHGIYRDLLKEMGIEDEKKWSDHKNDSKVVYIFTTQFLAASHAPTAKTLSIAKYLHKQGFVPVIINSAEFMGGDNPGMESFTSPHYVEKYSKCKNIGCDGTAIPFMQFPQGMPDTKMIESFWNMVEADRPAFGILVGEMSLMADVMNLAFPVISINTTNKIGLGHSSMQVLGREIESEDKVLLDAMGKDCGDVLSIGYTYASRKNGGTLNRSMFSIPDDCFLIGVVGNRLASELDSDFLTMINEVLCEKVRLAIIGDYPSYDEICEKYSNIGRYGYNCGFQTDIVSAICLVNLFVNPVRQGGGTTAVWALNEGIPVVTMKSGDVATASGDYFCVHTLDEMSNRIIDYSKNKELYEEAAIKAKERANDLFDEDRNYTDIFNGFFERIGIDF